MKDGIIVKGIGGFYYVDTGNEVIECKARGKFRITSGKPVVGDRVSIDMLSQNTGFITKIYESKNRLIRPPVCNLDQLVIVVSAKKPQTDLFLVDKVIAIAEHKHIDAIICINKSDIDMGCEIYDIYLKAGFDVIRTSTRTFEGMDALIERLRGRISAFTGNSGVGKSSILNCLSEDFCMETNEVSQKTWRGKHTTRHVELFKLPERGFIADTPGFSSFETQRMDLVLKDDLQYCFKEFAPFLGNCKFTGCSHVSEKGCSVIAAVSSGDIAKNRHESYARLYDSVKNIKEWEHKNVKK